jgi:hypothetical protein
MNDSVRPNEIESLANVDDAVAETGVPVAEYTPLMVSGRGWPP